LWRDILVVDRGAKAMNTRQARQIQKRARQRQRIAWRIKEIRSGNFKKQPFFDSILSLKQVASNYPKL